MLYRLGSGAGTQRPSTRATGREGRVRRSSLLVDSASNMLMRNSSSQYASFTKRLCARRILCFLKRHYLEGAAHQLERETTVFFDLSHLRFLATSARWDELTSYVAWFFPSDDPDPPSTQATTFLHRIHIYRVLAMIAAGGTQAEGVDKMYPLLDDAAAKANPDIASLRAFFHDVRRRGPRDYQSWVQFWQLAAKRLEDLALQCPELEGKLRLPQHYTPKRWQINLSGVRPILRPYKKEVKQKTCDVASFFDEKREEINRSLTGISSKGTRTTDSMISEVQTEATIQASVVAGALGGDREQLGSKEADNTSALMKRRKERETSDIIDAGEAATRSVKARKDDASSL